MEKEILPIGTVVLLKNAEKRIIITGYYPIEKDSGKTYDYCACLYPEGIIDFEKSLLFNKEDIQNIYFLGYSDIEGQDFISQLKEIKNN